MEPTRPAPPAVTHGPPATDAALVDAARAGDRRAFDELVRRHRPRVFALALHLTRSAADADDVAQDTFARAFRRLHRFEGRCRFTTWLHRIALNRAFSRIALARRRRAASLDDPRVFVDTPPSPRHDPHQACELRERQAALLDALARLSPSLRATLLLVAVDGVDQREAATRLGCRTGTIGWRLHQARAELRKTLDAPGPRADQGAAPQPRSDIAT